MQVVSHENSQNIARTLGETIIKMWSRLPPDIQHDLFEETLTLLGAPMRQQLAIFLHEKHSRTSAGTTSRATPEPDSLGG